MHSSPQDQWECINCVHSWISSHIAYALTLDNPITTHNVSCTNKQQQIITNQVRTMVGVLDARLHWYKDSERAGWGGMAYSVQCNSRSAQHQRGFLVVLKCA